MVPRALTGDNLEAFSPADEAGFCFVLDSASDLWGSPENVDTRWLWKRSRVSLRAGSMVIHTPVPGQPGPGQIVLGEFRALAGPSYDVVLGEAVGTLKIGLIM